MKGANVVTYDLLLASREGIKLVHQHQPCISNTPITSDAFVGESEICRAPRPLSWGSSRVAPCELPVPQGGGCCAACESTGAQKEAWEFFVAPLVFGKIPGPCTPHIRGGSFIV